MSVISASTAQKLSQPNSSIDISEYNIYQTCLYIRAKTPGQKNYDYRNYKVNKLKELLKTQSFWAIKMGIIQVVIGNVKSAPKFIIQHGIFNSINALF